MYLFDMSHAPNRAAILKNIYRDGNRPMSLSGIGPTVYASFVQNLIENGSSFCVVKPQTERQINKQKPPHLCNS